MIRWIVSLVLLLCGALLWVSCGGDSAPPLSAAVVEVSPQEEQLLHYPTDGHQVQVNPPGFTWTDHPEAGTYRLLVFEAGDRGSPRLDVSGLKSTVAALSEPLPPGDYIWMVVYEKEDGSVLGRSRERSFSLAPGVAELPMPDVGVLETSLSGRHPRLFLTPERLERIQSAVKENRVPLWQDFQELLEEGLEEPLYPEPAPYPNGEWSTPEWRRIYTPAKLGSSHMVRLALAYQLTGNEVYLRRARDWLLHLASWDPRGIASHDVTQPDGSEGNDEASMPLLERMSMTYDWIEGHLSDSQKQVVLAAMTERGNQVLAVLKQQDFLSKPFSNHEGRVLAFLGLAGLTFLGEIPEAGDWLDYVVRCYLTSYPVWGGDDGDWAQGLAYWSSYVLWLTEFADALRTVTDVDIYKRPFFRNTGYLPVYFHPPYASRGAFGDGGDGGPSLGEKLLIGKFAVAFSDPVLAWHAGRIPIRESGREGSNQWAMEDVHAVLDAGPSDLKPQPPTHLPPSKWLKDSGWVAAHSDLGEAENDVWVLFKSSRFGSFSHSHGDQNSFQLNAYGEPLLIDSGYYPWYGSPHHALWTRQTRAHNAILVNGRGQPPFSMAARGTIESFEQSGPVTMVRAEAAEAYNVASSDEIQAQWQEVFGEPHPPMGPRAEVVRRTLAFVQSRGRPWLAVHDYVQADQPTRFQYLLHALEKMNLDESGGRITVQSGQVLLDVHLLSDVGFQLSQVDKFPVAPEERYEGARQQFHLTAATQEDRPSVKFLAVMVPYRQGEEPTAVELIQSASTAGFKVGEDRVVAWWGSSETGSLSPGEPASRMLIEVSTAIGPTRVVSR